MSVITLSEFADKYHNIIHELDFILDISRDVQRPIPALEPVRIKYLCEVDRVTSVLSDLIIDISENDIITQSDYKKDFPLMTKAVINAVIDGKTKLEWPSEVFRNTAFIFCEWMLADKKHGIQVMINGNILRQ